MLHVLQQAVLGALDAVIAVRTGLFLEVLVLLLEDSAGSALTHITVLAVCAARIHHVHAVHVCVGTVVCVAA